MRDIAALTDARFGVHIAYSASTEHRRTLLDGDVLSVSRHHAAVWIMHMARSTELPVKVVIVDNGHYAESNHEFVQMFLGARTAPPIRAADSSKVKMRGERRRWQEKEFGRETYNPRRRWRSCSRWEVWVMGSYVRTRAAS